MRAKSTTTTKSSSLSECRILAWPLSLQEKQQENGTVVGWHTFSSTTTLTFPATAIVAAILPFNVQDCQERIVQLQQCVCHCCTCGDNNDNNQEDPCPGCRRRQFLGSLQVLARYNNDDSDSNDFSSTTANKNSTDASPPLARIRLINIGGNNGAWIPWIDEWKQPAKHDNDATEQYQILYYDDSETSACYSLDQLQQGYHSVLYRDILMYLSNSQWTWQQMIAIDPRDEPSVRDSSPRHAVDAPSSSYATEDTRPSGEIPGLARYSLFLQRVYSLYHKPNGLLLASIMRAPFSKPRDTVCDTCCKTCIQYSRSLRIHQRVEHWNAVLRAILDLTIGLLLVWLLNETLLSRGAANKFLNPLHDYIMLQSRLIQEGTSWLERFPIGFKLNEHLTASLGREIHAMVALHQTVLLKLVQVFDLLWVRQYCLVLCSGVGLLAGATGLLALLVDALRLAHVHVSILSLCFQSAFRCELYLLSALWRVFRGKKLNVLRNRTDSMQYDSIQLFVGSILFAITLFLFTTILAYHVFFAVCNLTVSLALCILYGLLALLREWPAGVLAARCLHGEWYAKGMYLAETPSPHPCISVTTLCPVLESSIASVSRGLRVPLSRILSLISSQLHGALLSGDETRRDSLFQ